MNGVDILFDYRIKCPNLFLLFKKNYPIMIEAHRGMRKEPFDNTLESFKKAIEYKIDGIEIDVHISKDGIPVVIHDGYPSNLYYKLPSNKPIKFLKLKQIKKIRTRRGNAPIPTLEEVLLLCKNKIHINIEIKDKRIKLAFGKVVSLIKKYDMFDQVFVSSFRHKYYGRTTKYNIKNLVSGNNNNFLGFCFLVRSRRKYYKKRYVESEPYNLVSIFYRAITRKMVRKLHNKKIIVVAFFGTRTKENERKYKKLIDRGVDIIVSNEPVNAQRFVDRYLGGKFFKKKY